MMQETENGNRIQDARYMIQDAEIRSQKTEDRKQDEGCEIQETEDGKQDARCTMRNSGFRSQNTGDRRKETELWIPDNSPRE